MIRIDRIIPDPNQPRTEFDTDALERLAASLKERGQLQPIRVRWSEPDDRYIVVVGERRWRAAKLAGLETLACVVTTGTATSDDILEDQLIENALREDLRPIEQAHAFKRLLESRGLTHRQLAEQLRFGHATITRSLALLNLPEAIQTAVDAGQIAPNIGYEISKVDDHVKQEQLAREAAAGRLKRDDVKRQVAAPKVRAGGSKKTPRKVTERTIRTESGSRVTVENRKGLDTAAVLRALEEAAEAVRGEIGAEEREAA